MYPSPFALKLIRGFCMHTVEKIAQKLGYYCIFGLLLYFWATTVFLGYFCIFENLPDVRISPLAKVRRIWDRCYDYFNIIAEKFSKKIGVFSPNKAKLCKNFDHNIGF
jgi:hypothetical protein